MNSSEDSFRMSQISSPQKDYSAAFKKCSALNNSLKTKCESLEETLSDLQKSYTAKQEEVEKEIQKRADLERKHTNTRQHVSNLQAKLTYQAGDAQMCKDLKAKVTSMQREVATLKGLKTILEGSAEDAEEILRNTDDKETMAMLVTGLKRDYNSLRKSKSEVVAHSESLQKQLNYSRIANQKLQGELTELKLEKEGLESDLSRAERKADSFHRLMGKFEDTSRTPGGFSLNVTTSPLNSKENKLAESTPVHVNKRPRNEPEFSPATPDLFGDTSDTSMDLLTKSFQAELRKDDALEDLAAALDVPLSMAAPSPRSTQYTQMKNMKQDNLFTKTGFDGLGGSTRIRKELAPVQKNTFRLSKNKHKMPSTLSGQGLAKSTTLGNFFRKL